MANRGRSTSRPSRLATRSFGSGFLFLATSRKDLRPQVFSSGARPQAKRKPAFAGFLREAQAQENIGFCFIVLYSDLLNGS